MKGKVLGFDAASGSGAISGENGERYNFTAGDFKSPAPAKPNDNVDFEADGANAKNIYLTAAAANVDLAAMASNPTVAAVLGKPAIIWSALVILGSLISGYLNAFSMMNLGGSAFLYILLFALPVLAAVQIFFELTNHAMTGQFRLITGIAAIALPIVVPLVVGSGGGMGMGGLFGGMGVYGGDWFGFNITPGKIVTVGGGVLMLLTHFGYIKKLG